MTTVEKVRLVASVVDRFPLTAALAAVELPASTWYYHQRRKVDFEAKYGHLQQSLEEIARAHPAYGYRRTTVELREGYGQPVNHKVVQRLHQLWGLRLPRTTRTPRPSGLRQVILAAGDRVNRVAPLTMIAPLQVLYTDFTELRYADGRQKAYFMPIIGHASRVVFGWAVGERANRQLARHAWRQARVALQTLGRDPAGLIMHHDQDAVFTSYDWTGRLLLREQMQLSYTLDGARDNPEMEAFLSRFKSENRSLLLDAPTIEALVQVVNERVTYYNDVRRHSSLGYVAPRTYLNRWLDTADNEKSGTTIVLADHTKT